VTIVKFSQPENRLAQTLRPTGILRSDAVQRAEANLKTIRGAVLAEIDFNIERLETLFMDFEPSPELTRTELYLASQTIAGVAGLFDLGALGAAAFSLCKLLAHFEQRGVWNRSAVKAHIDGMRVLRRVSAADEEGMGAMILNNLASLLAHFAPAPAGSDEKRHAAGASHADVATSAATG
jgi:hypothetical protein